MENARGEVRAVRWMLEDFPLERPQLSCGLISSNIPLVRWPGRFGRMAARSFVRIVQYEADVTVWSLCLNSVSNRPWQSHNTVNMTFLADSVTLNFLCKGDAECFHCMEARIVSDS